MQTRLPQLCYGRRLPYPEDFPNFDVFQLREQKPGAMAAPYDYSAYSAMDPHILQMADIGAGYWGAGKPSRAFRLF